MNILKNTKNDLSQAAEDLRAGKIVAIPTETVYGLAGNAYSSEVVSKIFETKERPRFDPLIVHLSQSWRSLDFLDRKGIICQKKIDLDTQKVISQLIETFTPGPLTLVLPKGERIPDLVTSGLDTVAIRFPNHTVTQELLELTSFPLAAPSANRFGRISPTSAESVRRELSGRVESVLDGGPCEVGIESTVLYVKSPDRLHILRPGKVSLEEISQLTHTQVILGNTENINHSEHLPSPGLLKSHYAPEKSLKLLSESLSSPDKIKDFRNKYEGTEKLALLLFSSLPADALPKNVTPYFLAPSLSFEVQPKEYLRTCAQNLFRMLREMDESSATLLVSERPPSTQGLGLGLLDRLEKASASE